MRLFWAIAEIVVWAMAKVIPNKLKRAISQLPHPIVNVIKGIVFCFKAAIVGLILYILERLISWPLHHLLGDNWQSSYQFLWL